MNVQWQVTALVPAGMTRRVPAALPEMSEHDVLRHFLHLSRETLGMTGISLFGTCTMRSNSALMVGNPDDMGIYNPEITDWIRNVHEAGGLCSWDHADFNGFMGKLRAAELGFDACMFMLHKAFGAPKGGNGPAVGAHGCTAVLARFVPEPVVVEEGALQARPRPARERRQGAQILGQRAAAHEGPCLDLCDDLAGLPREAGAARRAGPQRQRMRTVPATRQRAPRSLVQSKGRAGRPMRPKLSITRAAASWPQMTRAMTGAAPRRGVAMRAMVT